MYEFKCMNCGRIAILPTTNSTPKRFCNRKCYGEYLTKHKRMPKELPEVRKIAAADVAKAMSGDTGSKPLVDVEQCKRCAYGTGEQTSKACHCNYMVIKGHSRTSLHPEGLTSTCYEFEPKKKRGRPKKQGIVIKG